MWLNILLIHESFYGIILLENSNYQCLKELSTYRKQAMYLRAILKINKLKIISILIHKFFEEVLQ